jgi:DNA mismatch repair protein MutL
MGRIRILPESLINRIAAGEVVERPASVVKELMENSLDAGARSIELRLEDGGRKLVEVSDDGCGMDPDDAVAALDRHATSKISVRTALTEIETLGFRGEALPSVAAVSRFQLTTSDGRTGTRVSVEGGRIRSVEPAARAMGTTVTVRDLFFNTPARRRFLRAASTEASHIVETFIALALARFHVRLRFDHGRRRLFDLAAAPDLRGRLSQVEGPEAARVATPIEHEGPGATLTGFVVAGAGSGGARRGRRLLVNGRVVRDRLLTRAVSRALEDSLPTGSAASCMLSLRVTPAEVDVNVHPAKAEVRFAAPGRIHDLVYEAIRRSVGRSEHARPAPEPAGSWAPTAVPSQHRDGYPQDAARAAVADAAAAYLRRAERDRRESAPRHPPAAAGPVELQEVLPTGDLEVIGHYRSGYILAQDAEGLVMVDQHAAHERILFEELTAAENDSTVGVQSLLFPRTIALPARYRGRIAEVASELDGLGFESEEFGEGTLIVRGVPAPLADVDPEGLVLEILSEPDAEGAGAAGIEGRRRRMLATAACHAAVKVPGDLTPEKRAYILSRLMQCRAPLRCPHGRPTILRWGHRALERRFGRP